MLIEVNTAADPSKEGVAPDALDAFLEELAPLANVVVLPLYFISGVFVPVDSLPSWLGSIATVLPVAPLVKVLTWPVSFFVMISDTAKDFFVQRCACCV